MRSSALRMISRGSRLMVSSSGASSRLSFSTSRANSGDSSTPRRTHRPTPTSTMLNEEGQAPAPALERAAHRVGEQRDRAGREQQADRHADLRPAADEAAALGVAPLHAQRHRAAPLAADADPLDQAQQDEQRRRPEAERGVAGQHADERAGDAHQQQGRDQRGLAADPIAEVAEDGRADGAGGEAHGVGRERGERARVGARAREEQMREDQRRGRPVQEEVVPLDRGADGAGDHGAAHLACGADSPHRRCAAPPS